MDTAVTTRRMSLNSRSSGMGRSAHAGGSHPCAPPTIVWQSPGPPPQPLTCEQHLVYHALLARHGRRVLPRHGHGPVEGVGQVGAHHGVARVGGPLRTVARKDTGESERTADDGFTYCAWHLAPGDLLGHCVFRTIMHGLRSSCKQTAGLAGSGAHCSPAG